MECVVGEVNESRQDESKPETRKLDKFKYLSSTFKTVQQLMDDNKLQVKSVAKARVSLIAALGTDERFNCLHVTPTCRLLG